MKIQTFQNEYGWLSNFWLCNIEYEGLIYPSVENAYQAAKTTCTSLREPFTKYSSGQAKRAGKKLILRKDWNNIKLDIMEKLVTQKFTKYPYLKTKLLRTGDAIIEEGNYWRDTFWGVCNGVGDNYLGYILMNIRENLIYKGERNEN